MAKQAREPKWYDEIPNINIRKRIYESLKISTQEAVERLKSCGVDVSAEAVRQWCSGYTRPDISKIKDIAEALDCTCNYLLGVSETPYASNESIQSQLGLSDKSIDVLRMFQKVSNIEPAKNELRIINFLLENETKLNIFYFINAYLYDNYRVPHTNTFEISDDESDAVKNLVNDLRKKKVDEISVMVDKESGAPQYFCMQHVSAIHLLTIQNTLMNIRQKIIEDRIKEG